MSADQQKMIQEQILVLSESERESLYRFMQDLRRQSSQVPYEEWAKLPSDGAENHDHYLYGAQKKSH